MKTCAYLAAMILGATLSLSAAAAQVAGTQAAPDHAPGPVLGPKAQWVPGVLIAIGVLFLAAAFVGPIYRMIMPEEPQVEDFHSHDEPPGTSHHHGASGTIDHSAPDKPHHH